jgi:hypothetical protein
VKWNPASVKPSGAGLFLVADSMADGPYVAYYRKRQGWTEQGDDEESLNEWVTHWMELPPMPTDRASEIPDGNV